MQNKWFTFFDGSRQFMRESDVLSMAGGILSQLGFKRKKNRFSRDMAGHSQHFELQASKSGGYFLNYGIELSDLRGQKYIPFLMKNVHWGQRSSVVRSPGSVYLLFENETDVQNLCGVIIKLSRLMTKNFDEIKAGIFSGCLVTVIEDLS